MAFQNIHGLHSNTESFEDKINEVIHNMDKYQISILGLSEHNISMSNNQWRQRLSETIAKTRPGQVTHQFNSGPEASSNGRLVGGTGLIATDNIIGRIEPNGKGGDEIGRWSFFHLRRHQLPPVTVISIYQVCRMPTNAIGDTSWHQQRRYLDLTNRSDHPRKAFIQDLTGFITTIQNRGHSVIVGGDWNEWLGEKRSQLVSLCTALNLSDPWVAMNPHYQDFATYENGRHRIDSILISHELQESVTSIRYSPGGLLCATDHRAVIIDFNTKKFFGTTPPDISRMTTRGVQSTDKQSITKFIEEMHRHLTEQEAFNRGYTLSNGVETNVRLVEQLDKLVGEAGDIAEKRCRRRRATWFSAELATTRHVVSMLRYYVNGLKLQVDRSKSVRQRLQQHQVSIELPLDLSAAKILLQEHENKLQTITRTSCKVRQQEMSNSIPGTDQVTAKIRRRIVTQEQDAKTWKTLSFMRHATSHQTLNRIDVPASWPEASELLPHQLDIEDPKVAKEWRTVTDPQSIEQYLINHNCRHVGQAHGTPFTVPPLYPDIDWGANSCASHDILCGTYIDPGGQASELCKTLLATCQMATTDNSVPATVSLKDFAGKLKVWRESTTTSPSGRHLGRYKALLASGNFVPYSDEESRFQDKQKDIIQLILNIMNYCIHTGHPLQRWCSIANTMIFKELGVYRIHRLRVIHIFEADLNLIYAVKWRQLVKHADIHNLINPGQYGGRPGYEATSLALMEELRLDVAYTTRRTLATFDNDA